jgi:hypothetical protein
LNGRSIRGRRSRHDDGIQVNAAVIQCSKIFIAATLIWVLPPVSVLAQSAQQQHHHHEAQAHEARVDLWTGIVFASVGACIAPVTSAGDSRNARAVWGGIGLIGVGGTLIYLGIRDWPQAPASEHEHRRDDRAEGRCASSPTLMTRAASGVIAIWIRSDKQCSVSEAAIPARFVCSVRD